VGAYKDALGQAAIESLTMTDFASWQAVFTGADAWLHGYEDATTQVDRTGNGGDEVTRNGVTLVSDPPGWAWAATPPSGPSAQLDFVRGAFPFIPLRDHKWVSRGRPGRITALEKMRGSGPHPYGGFERFLFRRLHPDFSVSEVTVSVGAATALGASLQPALLVEVVAPAGTVGGASQQPVVLVTVPPAAASALGLAPAPSITGTVSPAAAVANGSAQQPVLLVVVPISSAVAAGSTPAPTVISGSGATATPGPAVASGSAPAPAVLIARAVAAATGVGAANAPTLLVRALPGPSTALGTAPPPAAGPAAAPAAATATGSTSAPLPRILVPPAAAVALGLVPTAVGLVGALITPASVTVTDSGQTVIVLDDTTVTNAHLLTDTEAAELTQTDVAP